MQMQCLIRNMQASKQQYTPTHKMQGCIAAHIKLRLQRALGYIIFLFVTPIFIFGWILISLDSLKKHRMPRRKK